MDYAIYFSNPISSAEDRVVVEYGGENIIGFEQVVQRYVESLGMFAVNLDPETDPELLKSTLADRGIEIEPKEWLMKGVPDLLLIDESGQVRFIEVKSPGDGLSDSQIEWALRSDAEISVAWVSVAGSNEYRLEDVKLDDKPVFHLDDSILGRDAIINAFYDFCESQRRRSRAEQILNVLKANCVVSEDELRERLGLKSEKELQELLEPLLGFREKSIGVVLGYYQGGCKYFKLLPAPVFEASFEDSLDSEVKMRIKNFLEEAEDPVTRTKGDDEDLRLLTDWF